MKKIILMMSFLVIMALIVSGCVEYPQSSQDPQSSPKNVANCEGEIEDSVLQRPKFKPYYCTGGITCQTNEGVQYSHMCRRASDNNGCDVDDCNPGDGFIGGMCDTVEIDPKSEISHS